LKKVRKSSDLRAFFVEQIDFYIFIKMKILNNLAESAKYFISLKNSKTQSLPYILPIFVGLIS